MMTRCELIAGFARLAAVAPINLIFRTTTLEKPNQEAKCRALRNWLTEPEVAATMAVAVNSLTLRSENPRGRG